MPSVRADLWVVLALCASASVLSGACGDSDASGELGASQAGSTAGAAPATPNTVAGSSGSLGAAGGGAGSVMPPGTGGTLAAAGSGASPGTSNTAGTSSTSGTSNTAGMSAVAGSGGVGAAGTAGTTPPADCTDTCAFTGGVEWLCKLRFMYGVNYAWHTFASDFGGNKAWNQPGVSGEPAVATELATMAAGGVNVIRWWLWPDFRGDGVIFDASDTPTGLGGTALADVERALELAEQNDLYVMLTIFSFDNFRATRMESTLKVRGITPMVVDDAKRRALMDTVVAPLARAVEASPHAKRMVAWDMINEPEWAINGASLYGGDPAFDPQTDLSTVSHAQMETFLSDTLKTLRANSKAQITVGGTAFKWRNAWSKLDLDFHQFHMYDWVNMYWPYDQTPMSYGLSDKPVVMGEFPMAGLTGAPYAKLLESWFGNKYAGALGWAFTDAMFSGSRDLSAVKAFADAHACETGY